MRTSGSGGGLPWQEVVAMFDEDLPTGRIGTYVDASEYDRVALLLQDAVVLLREASCATPCWDYHKDCWDCRAHDWLKRAECLRSASPEVQP